MRRFRHKLLAGFMIALGVVLVGLVCAPWWLPLALPRVLSRFNVHYSKYQPSGYTRFILFDLQYADEDVQFRAQRADLAQPLAWVWRHYFGSSTNSLLVVDNWELRIAPVDAKHPTKTPNQKAATGPGTPIDSVWAVINALASELGVIRNWVPRAELRNGTVEWNHQLLHLPVVDWGQGRLSGKLTKGDLPQSAQFRVDLSHGTQWSLETAVEPVDVRLGLQIQQAAASLQVQGTLLWQSNRIQIQARFLKEGWLPDTASVRGEDLRVPATLLHLDGYEDLTGSFTAGWTNGQFNVALEADAQPLPSGGLVSVHATVGLSGNTNQVQIERLTVHAPFLDAQLTEPVAATFRGRLLTPETRFDIAADLAKQTWFRATGTFRATAVLRPGAEQIPNVLLEASGQDLQIAGYLIERMDCASSFAWPWLDVSRANLVMFQGPTATLVLRANLSDQFVTNGTLHVEGPINAKLLPAGYTLSNLVLQADVHGPFKQLSHSGALELHQAKLSQTTPLDLFLHWSGRELDLNEFTGQIHAANARVELRGSANPPQHGQGGLRLEELTLVENGQMLYQLEQPFSVSLDRDRHVPDGRRSTWLLAIEPLRWRGPRGNLSVEAHLIWPESGSFAIDAEHFDSVPLNAFLEKSIPPVTLDKVGVDGGWTNGPIRFRAALGTHVSPMKELPFQAHLVAEGDGQGIRISELEVRDESSTVLTGHGAFPLRIEPGQAGNILQVDQQKGLELHARIEPNTAFWNQIASWTHLRLSDPRLQLEIAGSLLNPTGTVNAQFGAVDASKLWTNRPLPLLEDLRVNLELSRTALWLRSLEVAVEGQPLGASGRLPLGTNFATGWRRFFEWQQATGVLQVAHAQIAPFARFLPKIISPQGVFDLKLGVHTNGQWDGGLEISGAATRPLPSIGVMEILETKVKLHGRRVELQTFSGALGGEAFAASGDVDFDSLNPKTGMPSLELNLRGQSLPLARTADLILRGDLELKISSPTNAPALVSGAVRLRDSVFLSDLRVLVPGKVAQPSQRPPYFSFDVEPLADCRLNLQVQGDHFLKVRSPFFRGVVSARLKVEGTMKEPVASGEVAINSGQVQFPFATLDVTQGLVSLTSADAYHPQLYITAGARALGYDVKMEVTGKADTPALQFTSTPPLSSEQILLMLTAGDIPNQESSASMQQRASRLAVFLGKNLLSELTGDQGGADRLTIRSGEYLSDQGKQTYSLEYRLDKNWSIVGEYDRFGAFNAALKWKVFSH